MVIRAYPARLAAQSQRGIVACPHYLASQVGWKILQQGGHAVDAAIATNAALGVVYPHMTGLGGDGFWLIYDANHRAIQGLNSSGRAGQAVSRQRFVDQGLTTLPQRGPEAAMTVPGSLAGWWEAHQRFGRLPWAQLLQPAIDLAETGYPVTDILQQWIQSNASGLRDHNQSPLPFLPQDRIPRVGQWLTNLGLAATLRYLATAGVAGFYRGAVATSLVTHLQHQGGWLTLRDLAHHQATWVEPIATDYRGYRVYQMPPNSQGLTLLEMLNMVEPFDLRALGHGSVDYYHLMVEVTKIAVADRDRWLGDPDFTPVPVAALLDKAYGWQRSAQISWTQTQPYLPASLGGDTTYTAVVDGEGNAVSLIESLYFDFGTQLVLGDLGFPLQNRGALFSLDPEHPNCLAPGKRPLHTLMPALVLHPDGGLHLVLGTMGGEGQPQTQLALLTRVLDFGFDPYTAIDLPRWLWGRTWGETAANLCLEGRITATVQEGLRERGHPVQVTSAWDQRMGHAQMIRINRPGGRLEGSSDRRSDGAALGL